MELIDVLTPDGRCTGITKPKPEIHRDGDWHRAAHVWIVTPDGRILLQRRSRRKENNPGLWDVSAAGHVSAGEGAIESAIREVEEELGLRMAASELRHIGTIAESSVLNDGTYLDNEIHEIYVVVRDVDPTQLRLQAEEVDEVALIRPEELGQYDTVPHGNEYTLLVTSFRA